MDAALKAEAAALLDLLRGRGLLLATAESCTGGLISAALVAIPGSSDVLDCGFVTYSNDAKHRLLGVGKDILKSPGAVSEPVARAMAEGALANSRAHVAVAVTGIAGPGGGGADKPAGLVHFAAARRGHETRHEERRFGDLGRESVQHETVLAALKLVKEISEKANA